jgi:hypothetical protein
MRFNGFLALTISLIIPAAYAVDKTCAKASVNETFYSADDKVVTAGTSAEFARLPANSLDFAVVPVLSGPLPAKIAVLEAAVGAVHPGGQVRAHGLTHAELGGFFTAVKAKYGEDVSADYRLRADGLNSVILSVLNKPGIPYQKIETDPSLEYGQSW